MIYVLLYIFFILFLALGSFFFIKLIFFKPKTDKGKNVLKFLGIGAAVSLALGMVFMSIVDDEENAIRREKQKIFEKEEAIALKRKYDHTIQFEKNKSGLSVEAKSKLDSLVIELRDYEEKCQGVISIKVVGHTSSEGDAKLNQKLSEERAKSCLDYIENSGFSSDYYRKNNSEGKGSSEPIDESKPELNRRIEFFFKMTNK